MQKATQRRISGLSLSTTSSYISL